MARKLPPRIITIVSRDNGSGDFDIHVGETLVRGLCWDEMLGSVAVITHPQLGNQTSPIPPYSRLQHIDDLLFCKVKWQEMCRPADKEIIDPMFREVGE